jgi:hypothetical protein
MKMQNKMTKNEIELVGIVANLCDTVSDTPCGCDACPYVDTMNDGQCEVYDVLAKVKGGVDNG